MDERDQQQFEEVLAEMHAAEEAKVSRCTNEEIERRNREALELLQDCSPATATRKLAQKYGVSPRQARRYVKAAVCLSFDAPLSTDELGFSLAMNMERLERIADEASEAGDKKLEIAATNAALKAAEARLKAIQQENARTESIRLRYGA